jgi:hypothetical protein
MIYELREYVALDHAQDKVHDRFRDATLPLFERHGLDVAGFWTDADDPRRIVYLLRFEDSDAQQQAWAGFQGDPQWTAAKEASEADGPIVGSMSSRTLQPVPYWPTHPRGDAR